MNTNDTKLVLVDVNPQVTRAFREAFAVAEHGFVGSGLGLGLAPTDGLGAGLGDGLREGLGEGPAHGVVEVVCGSMLDLRVDAWVSPTNARGDMNGGLDAAIRRRLGAGVQARVKAEIARRFGGWLPVGAAVCVPTGRRSPRYVVSTATMTGSSDDVSSTLNAALAACAALQAVAEHNRRGGEPIRSVALPGLGTGTGGVSPTLCADLVYTAVRLHATQTFEDFAAVRRGLEREVGPLDPLDDEAIWASRARHYREAHVAL